MSDDLWFEQLAEATGAATGEHAPATLKSKIYSRVVARMAESAPLLDLIDTKKTGDLCIFENILTLLPLGADVRSKNPCRICHARVLGERVEQAPIFWPGCPYAEFHRH